MDHAQKQDSACPWKLPGSRTANTRKLGPSKLSGGREAGHSRDAAMASRAGHVLPCRRRCRIPPEPLLAQEGLLTAFSFWAYDRPVAGVCGQRPSQPRDLLVGVVAQARRLGRPVAGDDLFLLALSELPGDPPARRALEAEGLDSGRISEEVRTRGDAQADWDGKLHFAPALYLVVGGPRHSRLLSATARSHQSTY